MLKTYIIFIQAYQILGSIIARKVVTKSKIGNNLPVILASVREINV